MSGIFDLERRGLARSLGAAEVQRMIGTLLNQACPVGTYRHHAGATVEDGWLACDGQAVSRTVYPELFAELGVTYGAGDGSTTFNLPDSRGRTLVDDGTGTDLTARARGDKVGAETHALGVAELPSHTHTTPNHSHSYSHTHTWGQRTTDAGTTTTGTGVPPHNNAPTGGAIETANQSATTTGNAAPTTNATGSGNAHNNMQPSLVASLLIRAVPWP